jgi:hypothetical protein
MEDEGSSLAPSKRLSNLIKQAVGPPHVGWLVIWRYAIKVKLSISYVDGLIGLKFGSTGWW